MTGKYRYLPIDKLILVSKPGFFPSAREAAAARGIEVFEMCDALDYGWAQVVNRLKTVHLALVELVPTEFILDLEPPLTSQSEDSLALNTPVFDEHGIPIGSIDTNIRELLWLARSEITGKTQPKAAQTFVIEASPIGAAFLWTAIGKHRVTAVHLRIEFSASPPIRVDLQAGAIRDHPLTYGSIKAQNIKGLLVGFEQQAGCHSPRIVWDLDLKESE